MLAQFLNDNSSWTDRLVEITGNSQDVNIRNTKRQCLNNGDNETAAKITKHGYPVEIDLN